MSKKKKIVELYCPRCDYRFTVEVTGKQPRYMEIRCPRCASSNVIEYGKVKSTLYVEGSNADEVKTVMTSLMKESKGKMGLKPIRNPWISGSFYLAAILSISMLFLVIAKQVHPLVFPIVLIGSVIAVSIIGAFQLRQDKSLRECFEIPFRLC